MSTRASIFIAAPPLRTLMEPVSPQIAAPPAGADLGAFHNVPRLTAALRRGDEAAFSWLHQHWSGRIQRYCFALAAGDENFAREIAQAAWLRLVRYVRVMADEQMLWNWIAQAARHAASDLRRQGGRYAQALRRFAEWWKKPRSLAGDERADQLLSALESALQQLPADERSLLEAKYFAGESVESIAQHHALSARAVEGRLARLRVRLRELMAKELQALIS